MIGLITGHLWIYPDTISQGWDSTLAHIPYFDMRAKMIYYVKENDIDPMTVGTHFSNISDTKYTDVVEESFEFVNASDLGFDKATYILQSNVLNEFSDEELVALKAGKDWVLEKELEKMGVYMRLYKRR